MPMSHRMISAVGKGIDRAYGMSKKEAQVGLPLLWSLLSQGRQALSMEEGGRVMTLGLAVSYYFLLCRTSELWAYAEGNVHPERCLTRVCLSFSRGVQVEFENISTATVVQIIFFCGAQGRRKNENYKN